MVTSFNPRARDGRERSDGVCSFRTARFNPRARDGREHQSRKYWVVVFLFQSTRP